MNYQQLSGKDGLNVIDQMNHARLSNVTRAAFAIVDAIQRENPGEQVLANALAFLIYCRKYGVNPRDVLYKASAVITDGANANNEHLFAIAHFCQVHLKGDTKDHLL